MPRIARVCPGGFVYHVFNRAIGKLRLFRKDQDFQTFYDVLIQAHSRFPIPIFGWCVMGNHWHLVLQPEEDGDLSRFLGYLALTHAARWQVAHKAVGTGHVYQGRFRSCMVQNDEHLLSVLRYVEGNPLRADVVQRAQDWRWSSMHARLTGPAEMRELLSEWPIARPTNWTRLVNSPQTVAEVESINLSMMRGRPLGSDAWVKRMVTRFNLQTTLRPRGRPPGWRKSKKKTV